MLAPVYIQKRIGIKKTAKIVEHIVKEIDKATSPFAK